MRSYEPRLSLSFRRPVYSVQRYQIRHADQFRKLKCRESKEEVIVRTAREQYAPRYYYRMALAME